MKFYRITKNQVLHSFGDPIGEVPVLGRKLSELQHKAIVSVGGELIDIGDKSEVNQNESCFIFSENLYFSDVFLKKCIMASQTQNSSLRFAFQQNDFNERFVLPHPNDEKEKHIFDFYFCDGKNQNFQICVIPQQIFEHTYEFPQQIIPGRKYHTHQSECYCTHIISPFHLLFANMAANLSRAAKLQSKIPPALKRTFGKYHSRWYYRGLKRLNKIGKNCQIHPTAIIEGSVIGDNCIIGANTIVRLSHLENNTYLSDNVTVINCILGERTFISNSNYINSVLCFEEAFMIHGPYQLSVFGKNSACFAVINCDIRLDNKTIAIPTSEGLIDSRQYLLGIAYGHRSKTGGGNIIAAGRIVPNDLHIVPPDNIILNFDKK
jgi:hypothetical protein